MRSSSIINVLFIFCIYVLLVFTFLHPIVIDVGNSDLGRHLILGNIILQTGEVPKTNLLTYTNQDFPFINTHWLSEVIFSFLNNILGFNGLILFSVILVSIAFSFVFIPSIKYNVKLALLVAVPYIMLLSERSDVRPEIFSYLFLSIFLFLLYKYRQRYTNWIFVIPLLELLWVNTHIYFFVGIIILIFFLFDAFLFHKKSSSRKQYTLAFVTLLSTLATILNPHLLKGAVYPFFVLNDYGFVVQENTSFFSALQLYSSPTFIYFFVTLILLWTGILLARKKMEILDYLLASFFTILLFLAVRNVPLFAFGTFLICVKALHYSISDTKYIFLTKINNNQWFTGIFILIIILVSPTIYGNFILKGFGLGLQDNSYEAITFIKENKIKGPIFNNFDIGNYLDYRLYPQEKAFVDNRPEAYPKSFFQQIYYPSLGSYALFNELSDQYRFNMIILAHNEVAQTTSKLIYELASDNKWRMVYFNSYVVIFIRNTSENSTIIQRYAISEKTAKINSNDLNNIDKTRNLANFFNALDWYEAQLTVTTKYLDYEPNNCGVLGNIIFLLQQKKDPSASIYVNKYIKSCI